MKIGVTGGIGCGKSEVCLKLRELGACVVSADEIVHRLYAPEGRARAAVEDMFGAEVVGERGGIVRPVLRRVILGDSAKRKELERIIWPMIESEVLEAWETCRTDLYVLDAAVLMEAGWDAIIDTIWIVEASSMVVRSRLVAKGFTVAELEAFSNAQLKAPERKRVAISTGKPVEVIVNNSDIEVLHRQVYNLWQTVTRH